MTNARRQRLVRAFALLLNVDPPTIPVHVPSTAPADAIRDAGAIVGKAITGTRNTDRLYEGFVPASYGTATITTRSEGALVIESDGTGRNTRVMIDGRPLPGLLAAHWRVEGNGVARAIFEVDGVAIKQNVADANVADANVADANVAAITPAFPY